MPNWCNNHIRVRGTNQREIQRLADAFEKGEFCNAVIPTPQDLIDTVAGSVPEGPEREAHEAQMKRNRELYGAKDWYDFQTSRWGTKWDVGGNDFPLDRDEDGLGFSASFDSAWSPPMGVVEELTNRGLSVTLYYYEPGVGYVGKYEDGDDDCYDYGGETSKTIRSAIGDELTDFWNLEETLAEYEDEEEDLYRWTKEGAAERNADAG